MVPERALKAVLVVFGLVFAASIYPVVGGIVHANASGEDHGDTMMLSLYFAMGIFLLLAARNPAAHRSLILFAGWANIAHGGVMGLMSIRLVSERSGFLWASAMFGGIGLVLLLLSPKRMSATAG
jgi:cytochrome c biogenesis protein CcdA